MKQLLYSLINLLFGINVSELIRKNKALETERDLLLRKFEYSESKVLNREKNLASITAEQKASTDKNQELETTLASTQAKIKEKERENEALKNKADEWKSKRQESEKLQSDKIDNLKKQLELVENQVKVKSESKFELAKQIGRLTSETNVLQEQCNSVNNINKTLETENSNLKIEVSEENKRCAALKNSFEETNDKNSELQKKIDKLNKEIAQLKAEGKKEKTGVLTEPEDAYEPTVDNKKSNAPEKAAEEHEKGTTSEADEPKEDNHKAKKEAVKDNSTSKAIKKNSTTNTATTPSSSAKMEVENITRKPTQQRVTQRLLDGTLIEHNNINVGERIESESKPEEGIFEYSGKFLFDMKKRNQPDADKFAHAFYPKLDTPVLKWHKSSASVTSGVTEPLLIKALEKLTQLVPEIELHQNTSLSICNRNYSYRPDIALVWKKHNLYIDVEVDEPYDIVSRKPIHYFNSSDYLRNLYFISQGWVVIRFSEEQVYSTTDHCVAYIASILKEITKESVFDELIATIELNEQERWSYDKAKELEREKHRESYLNIEDIKQFEKTSNDTIDSTPFAGVTPAVDILPENVEHTHYEQIINNRAAKYIRLTLWPTETQYILEDYKQKTELYRREVVGYDILNKKNDSFTFDKIMLIEPLDSPFKHPLLEQHDVEDILKIKEYIFEAIYNFNPISIKYEDSNGNLSQRIITYIGYERDSKERLADNIWTNYYSNYSNKDDAARRKLVAYCQLKNEQRTFFDGKIQAIQVYNFRDIGMGHLHSFTEALWHPIKENDMDLAHHIAGIMPQFVKDLMNVDVVLAGNYAHYLLLTGKTEQALEIYKQHEGLQITDDLDWRQIVLQDFETLKDIADYSEKFVEAKRLLGWK